MATNKMPIKATIVTAPPLPGRIDFLSKLADLKKCTRGTYVAGYDKEDEAYVLSHMNDWPMKGYSMNTSTGKSTLLRCIIAQLLHNEPNARVIAWDTKRVSLNCFSKFRALHSIMTLGIWPQCGKDGKTLRRKWITAMPF